MIYIGIDNGLSGAVAGIDTSDYTVERDGQAVAVSRDAWTKPLPVVNKALDCSTFANLIRNESELGTLVAMVERPAIIQKTGRMSILRTGTCFGQIIGVLATLQVPYEIVMASQWKRSVLAGTDRSKQAAIAKAQSLFPGARLHRTLKSRKPDHNLAEALLIAEYCRRIHSGAASCPRTAKSVDASAK